MLRRAPAPPVVYPNELPELQWREDLRTARAGLTGERLGRLAPQLKAELRAFQAWLTNGVQLDRPGGALQVRSTRNSGYSL